MNYQKIAIKQLLTGDLDLFLTLSVDNFTQKIPATLFKGIGSYYNKHNVIPSVDVLSAYIDQNFSEDNAKLYTSYLKSLSKIDIDGLDNRILIDELKHGKRIKEIDSNIEALIDASANRDVDSINEIISKLYETVDVTQVPVENLEDINPEEYQIASLECCFESFRENNTRLEGLTILTGGSGSGKSLLAVEQAVYSYMKEDIDVLFISQELPKKAIWSRIISHMTMIPYSKIYYHFDDLSKEEVELVEGVKESLRNKPNKFKIIDTPMSPDDIKKLVRKEHKARKLGLVVIDYISIVQAPNDGETWRWVEKFVKELHQLTLELGVVILSPAQVHQQEVEIKGTEVYLRTRGSAELINSSSLLLHIHNPSDADDTEEEKNIRVIYTAKARNAKKIGVFCETQFQYQRFQDLKVKVE